MSLITNKTKNDEMGRNSTINYVKPAPTISLANVQSMWFDSEISDQAVTPSTIHLLHYVFCQDRTVQASTGVCAMVNLLWLIG